MSALKKFLDSNSDRLVKSKTLSSKRPITHVLLDEGRPLKIYTGRLSITASERDDMYTAIATDFQSEKLMYPVVEIFPDKARFAIDLDFKTPAQIETEQRDAYMRTVMRTVCRWSEEQSQPDPCDEDYSVWTDPLTCIVCDPIGPVRKHGGLIKDGSHLIWPNIVITHDQARYLVNHVILPELQGQHEDIDWPATLDDSIYNAGKGLRMCYTVKRSICKPCKAIARAYTNRRGECETCADQKFGAPCTGCKPETRINNDCASCGGGIVCIDSTDHYYHPSAVYDCELNLRSKSTKELQDDPVKALQFTSITHPCHSVKTTFSFKPPVASSRKRKAAQIPLPAAKRCETLNSYTPRLTSEQVLKIYRDAGGQHELQEFTNARALQYRELSPGVDARHCLAEDCPTAAAGEKHTDNALLQETSIGLLYTCCSTQVKTYIWKHPEVNERELLKGGDIGLAHLLYQLRGQDIVNIAGDSTEAKYYVFDAICGLWKEQFSSYIKSKEMPLLITIAKEHAKEQREKVYQLRKQMGKNPSEPDMNHLASQEREMELLNSLVPQLQSHGKRLAILHDCMAVFRNIEAGKLFDKLHDHLSVANGVVNLRTGQFRPRAKTDYLTVCSNVSYNPDADMTVWMQFINDITLAERLDDHKELPAALQRVIGWFCTGLVHEQLFFIFYGPHGSNAKSLLMSTISLVMGKLWVTLKPAVMCDPGVRKQGGAAESHLAVTRGKRCGYIPELEQGAKLDEQQIKTFTGESRTDARDLYERQCDGAFETTSKVCALCNELPTIRTTPFVLRRVYMMVFLAKFLDPHNPQPMLRFNPDDLTHFKLDKQMEHKLKGHLEAVLLWIIEGARIALTDGVGHMPVACQEALAAALEESDYLQQFIDRKCFVKGQELPDGMIQGQSSYEYPVSRFNEKLYAFVVQLAKDTEQRVSPPTKREAEQLLANKGFYKKKSKSGDYKDKWVFIGLCHRDEHTLTD